VPDQEEEQGDEEEEQVEESEEHGQGGEPSNPSDPEGEDPYDEDYIIEEWKVMVYHKDGGDAHFPSMLR
jgi:hypothetical protein